MYEATYMPQIYTNRMTTLRSYVTLEDLLADNSSELISNQSKVELYHNEKFLEFLKEERSIKRKLVNAIKQFYLDSLLHCSRVRSKSKE